MCEYISKRTDLSKTMLLFHLRTKIVALNTLRLEARKTNAILIVHFYTIPFASFIFIANLVFENVEVLIFI